MQDGRALRSTLYKLRRKKKLLAGVIVVALSMAVVQAVRAIDDLQMVIERVDGAGWSADGIAVDLSLVQRQSAASAFVSRLTLTGQTPVLRDVRISCPKLELSDRNIGCADAAIAVVLPDVGSQELRGRLSYDRGSGAIDFDVRAVRFAGGAMHMRGAFNERGWHADLDVERVNVEEVSKLAAAIKAPLQGISASGRLSAQINVSGQKRLQRATLAGRIDDLSANNETGTLASDKLSLLIRASLRAVGAAWNYDVELDATGGQAYAQPVFLDFAAHSLKLRGKGRLDANNQIIAESFQVDHADVLQVQGRARVDVNNKQPVRDLTLELQSLQFPGAYSSYLQPFLLDTDFKQLTSSGHISGSVQIEEGVPQRVALHIDNVSFDDGTRTFALSGLRGHVSWRNGDDEDADAVLRSGSDPSTLSWQGGSLLNLELGAATLNFTTIGRNFRLVEPTRIALLDGSIDFESLRIRNAGKANVAFMVDATVQPISVAQLCRAFGWPEFGGSVGGQISKLRLRDGVVTLGTTLQARVFDGRVAIKDLRLEDALGKWPKFYSSIELTNLDLELVTRAFSFGRITGRLSGAINELQLFNWQPIAFDATLYTPPDDQSKHRISQRAVENIGSIGGGGSGITQALSGGVLRFFDEFRYERLGLSCRLVNEICYMDGVAPAPNGGYYLVKGSGLPRIDVIGGARRVDWPRLVQQLIAISESEGPVVE